MFIFNKAFLSPKSWLFALLIGCLWCFTRLPYRVQIRYGRKFGAFIYAKSSKVRRVTQANIGVCFPKLNQQEIDRMARESDQELGIAIAETFFTWFCNYQKLYQTSVEVIGEQNYRDALAQNKGIILLSCHFGSVDLNAVLMSRLESNGRKLIASYRPINPFVNHFLKCMRLKYGADVVESDNLRGLAKALKKGGILWYAPDMEVKNKGSIFVDFMGVKASTTTGLSRMAKLTGAVVLPVAHYRVSDKPEYQLKIMPALQNFPTDDIEQDTSTMNRVIEEIIAPYPERYWWPIKRFKHRPDGEADIYSNC